VSLDNVHFFPKEFLKGSESNLKKNSKILKGPQVMRVNEGDID
jgi:hypothetical protein